MRTFSLHAARLAFVAAVAVAAVGCGQVGVLKSRMAFRDANALYQAQDYEAAAAKYEEALAADPSQTVIYFYLGNSYDNLFRPARRGEPENDEYLLKAIDNYKKAAELADDPSTKQYALEYLVAAYGPEKLNDPTAAEPVVLHMIDLDPTEPRNYFYLSKIYEDQEDFERAEGMLLKAREVRPNSPEVYMQVAAYYNRRGDFEKTMEALHARAEQEPNNPEAFHTIATYYWEKAYRDETLPKADKMKYVEAGIQAVDQAITLKDDYSDALTYKNLLLRVQANLETDPARQQDLLKQAIEYGERAQEIRERQLGAPAASAASSSSGE